MKVYLSVPIILLIILLMHSCQYFKQKSKINAPAKTDLCFGSSDAGTFIQLHIADDASVTGNIVNIEGTTNGTFINDSGHLVGQFIDDTTMLVEVFYEDFESRKWSRHENWILNAANNEMSVRTIDVKEEILFYKKDCDFIITFFNAPLVSDADYLHDEEEENMALKDNFIYYRFTSSDANKRTIVQDYIQMKISGDTIEGIGIGMSEGSPFWKMQFIGTHSNSSKFSVNVHYQEEEDGVAFDDIESWTIVESGNLLRHDCKAIKNLMAEKEYHQIAAKDIPYDFSNRMR